MFTGKKLEVSHLKIFGCPVYVHIPKEKRTKLDTSEKKGIFVGYCEVSKAFRIYIPGFHHMEILMKKHLSRDPKNVNMKKCMRKMEDVPPGKVETTSLPRDEVHEEHDMTKAQAPPTMEIS